MAIVRAVTPDGHGGGPTKGASAICRLTASWVTKPGGATTLGSATLITATTLGRPYRATAARRSGVATPSAGPTSCEAVSGAA